MRTKLLVLITLPILLLECSTPLWTLITRKDSKLYSDTEKSILADTTSAIDFKYGYDPDLEIDYVYKAGAITDKDITAKSPDMKKALLKYKSAEIISFFEKIIELRECQVWKMNLFREKQNWVDATYIQKHLLPETEQYYNILENNVIQIDAVYAGTIEKRKAEIKNHTEIRLQKELEAREKEMQQE